MIADRAGDLALSIPNFCSYDAEGNLYVSNSSSQPAAKVFEEFTAPAPNGALARIRPDGRGEVVATGIYFANGTAIDPNEDAVYVLESSRYDCVRIAIKKDGTFGKPEVYASGFPAIPDGMAFDVNRNLYITLPGIPKDGKLAPMNKIIRVDTSGEWELLVDDPDGTKLAFPTNCALRRTRIAGPVYCQPRRGPLQSRAHERVWTSTISPEVIEKRGKGSKGKWARKKAKLSCVYSPLRPFAFSPYCHPADLN